MHYHYQEIHDEKIRAQGTVLTFANPKEILVRMYILMAAIWGEVYIKDK